VTVSAPRLLTIPIQACGYPEGCQRFQDELAKGGPINVDLFSRDPVRAFERLQGNLKPRVKLIVDAVAQEAVKRKVRGNYLLYCESLSAADWAAIVQSLAAADKKGGDALFDTAVVTPLDTVDRAELTSVLGADPRSDPSRGAGGTLNRSSSRSRNKAALAAVIWPWRTPANSKEVRQFLDARSEAPDQSVEVILTIRPPLN
jgi:hypothetical protein